jgi:hypothetical protein
MQRTGQEPLHLKKKKKKKKKIITPQILAHPYKKCHQDYFTPCILDCDTNATYTNFTLLFTYICIFPFRLQIAWCLTYLFLNLRRTIRQPKPMPSLLVAGVMSNLVISGRKTLEVEFGI